jgi:hypothetical protein
LSPAGTVGRVRRWDAAGTCVDRPGSDMGATYLGCHSDEGGADGEGALQLHGVGAPLLQGELTMHARHRRSQLLISEEWSLFWCRFVRKKQRISKENKFTRGSRSGRVKRTRLTNSDDSSESFPVTGGESTMSKRRQDICPTTASGPRISPVQPRRSRIVKRRIVS